MKLRGLETPLEATGSHAIFSEDLQKFVKASDLRVGTTLRTRSGTTTVESVIKKPGRYDIFNLEVAGAHHYYVTEQSVLVHNAEECELAKGGGAHSETSKPVGDGLDSNHVPPKSVSGLPPEESPAFKMKPEDHRLTPSWGPSTAAQIYRQMLADLLAAGRVCDVYAIEIRNIRNIFGSTYNKQIAQMLKYAKDIGYLTRR